MVYAENIKKIRNNFNLSIAKMASKLGMSSRTLTSYEREERKPSCDFAYKLYSAQFLHNLHLVTLNYIV